MIEMIQKEYKYNKKFRAYVDLYAKIHGIAVEEAIRHDIVRRKFLQYTEV